MKTLKEDWWVIVLIGCFVAVAATDPWVWAALSRWWPIVALGCLGIGLIIGAVWGRIHGQKEYARGFRNGENWGKPL